MTVTHEPAVVPSSAAVPTVAPMPRRPRTWLRKIWGGGQIIETCPEWCENGHVGDMSIGGHVSDLTHGTAEVATHMSVFDSECGTLAMPILSARINVDPYSEDPARNVPHVTFEPFADEVMECLTPDEFAAEIAKVRAHCDRLDEVVAQAVKARAEYGAR